MCGPSNLLRAPSLWLPFSSCNNVSSKCSTYYCSLCTPTAVRPELFLAFVACYLLPHLYNIVTLFLFLFLFSLSLFFSIYTHTDTHTLSLSHIGNPLFSTLAFPSLSFNVPCINAFCYLHLHSSQCYSQQQE